MYLYHFGPAKILKLLLQNHNEKEATEDDYPFNSYLNTFCITWAREYIEIPCVHCISSSSEVLQKQNILEAVKSENLRSNSSWNIRQRV